MSGVVRKPLGFPTRSDTNQALGPQRMARGLKFWIYVVEGLYTLCSKSKGADQLVAQLICSIAFAYAKIRFSHDVAHV